MISILQPRWSSPSLSFSLVHYHRLPPSPSLCRGFVAIAVPVPGQAQGCGDGVHVATGRYLEGAGSQRAQDLVGCTWGHRWSNVIRVNVIPPSPPPGGVNMANCPISLYYFIFCYYLLIYDNCLVVVAASGIVVGVPWFCLLRSCSHIYTHITYS